MSSSVTATSSGSPSCSVSVVPSSSIPSHGTAKLTRTWSWAIVSAACQSWAPSTRTCTPLLRRIDGRAPGSSSRRTRSTHGPVALTIAPARTGIVRPSATTSAPPAPDRDDLGVVQDDRAAVGGAADVGDRQAPVVRPRVGVQPARAQAPPPERGHERGGLVGADEPVQPRVGDHRVRDDPALHEPRPVRAVLVEREQERQPVDEMRRDDVRQRPPLVVSLAHQPHVAQAQVAQAAVNQLRRRRRGGGCEVAPVDERDRESVRRGGLRDPRPDDPAADDEQVEAARG